MTTQAYNVLSMAVPFSTRMDAAGKVIALLRKEKCSIETMHVGARSVVIKLEKKPKFSGDAIKVVGGSQGLYQVYRRKFGIVYVEWLTPYVHRPVRYH